MSSHASINDTIVAIASPLTGASRGIVRMSGPQSLDVLTRLGMAGLPTRTARRLTVNMDLHSPLGVIPVDVLVWPNQRSYTGEPSAELHTYGCIPILQRLIDRAVVAGARAARPGEFTLRAFLAGRLDLIQAEAVLGVIDAEDRGALDSALRQLAGNLSRPLEQMRSDMLDLLADVEAGLDFVDEDIQFVSEQDLQRRLSAIAEQVDVVRATLVDRRDASAMTVVAFRGEPNAGKSRLINTLTNSDAAIVADVAGTTRDTVTIDVKHQGHIIRLIDTAGIESNDHEVSRAAQAQAELAMQDADVRIWCVDGASSSFQDSVCSLMNIASTATANRLDLWVATKSDTMTESQRKQVALSFGDISQADRFITSSLTRDGIPELFERIVSAVHARQAQESGSVLGTAARCSGSLLHACEALRNAIALTVNQSGHEFVSSELRLAIEHIGEVTGAVYTDDILDRVFSRFCIGK